jgi:hypothetical protein
MDILQHFKLFRLQMAEQPAPGHRESVPDDPHRVAGPDFACRVRPHQVISVNGLPAGGFNNERIDPVH